MAWIAGLAAGGTQGASSMYGIQVQKEAQEKAMGLIEQSVKDLSAVGFPAEEALKISLEKYRSAGILTPELEQNILQGQSELKGIETDPRLASAQMDALDQLRSLGEGGFSISDKAALEKGLGQVRAQEKGQRDAILQDAAQRGATTSGGTLAAQLINQQGAAQSANQVGLDTAALGYQRALDAIRSGGALAGDIQGRQFGQQAQIASAQDVINQMNTGAMQGVQQRNIASKNSAQAANLQNAQDIMNLNTQTGQQQEIYNRQLPQQKFQNEMAKAQALAGARSGQAQTTLTGGQNAAQMWGGLGSGAGKIGSSFANYNYGTGQQKNTNQFANTTVANQDEKDPHRSWRDE